MRSVEVWRRSECGLQRAARKVCCAGRLHASQQIPDLQRVVNPCVSPSRRAGFRPLAGRVRYKADCPGASASCASDLAES